MNKQLKRAIVVILIGLAGPVTGSMAEEKQDRVALDRCYPEKLSHEGNIDLTSYKNKLLYVDFWASWCGPCKLSFPFMNDIKNEFADKGLEIVAINLDKKEKDARKFLERNPAYFTVGLDKFGTCPRDFDVKGMPHSFIVDGSGKVLYSHVGFRASDPEKVRGVLTGLLEEHRHD